MKNLLQPGLKKKQKRVNPSKKPETANRKEKQFWPPALCRFWKELKWRDKENKETKKGKEKKKKRDKKLKKPTKEKKRNNKGAIFPNKIERVYRKWN